jgi:nitroreductase
MPKNHPEHSIMETFVHRWSPYRFEPREVEDEKILGCLEAARWAASSFNDQPWSWIVARRQDGQAFAQMLGCLLEANQSWAKEAGVLLLTVSRNTFRRGGKPNRVALHDLGQAAAHLALQAASVGLQAHQMAGVNLSLVRQRYAIPDGFDPQTAIALGYPATAEPDGELAKELSQRDNGPRIRQPLADQVFGGKWGDRADFVPEN